MSRNFVNGLANFVVEGNLVSFTLTDQRTDGRGQPAGPPQPVSDVMMRLSDFTAMVGYLSEAAKEIDKKAPAQGRPAPVAAAQPRVQPKPSDGRPPLGAKLTPKS